MVFVNRQSSFVKADMQTIDEVLFGGIIPAGPAKLLSSAHSRQRKRVRKQARRAAAPGSRFRSARSQGIGGHAPFAPAHPEETARLTRSAEAPLRGRPARLRPFRPPGAAGPGAAARSRAGLRTAASP